MTRHVTAKEKRDRYTALHKEYHRLTKQLAETTDELQQFKIREELHEIKADADALSFGSDSRYPFPSWEMLNQLADMDEQP